MKAIVLKKYGTIDDMIYTDRPTPTIKDDEVLVKLHFTSLNSADLDFIHGHHLVRFTGFRKPGYPILGSDCVGTIEETGSKVTNLRKGDKVWADLSNPLSYGTFAECVSVLAKSLRILPDDIPMADAACLPSAAMVALQNIQPSKKGDKILVNGAGGGIGTIIVQLLANQGADITAVDRVEKHDMLKSIGANRTIDYREINYTAEGIIYDQVYDLLCTRDINTCMSVVQKHGSFTMLGGSTKNILKVLISGPFLSKQLGKKVILGGWDTNKLTDLDRLAKLYREGVIKPVIEKIVRLEDGIQALKQLEAGHVIGKIVIDTTNM